MRARRRRRAILGAATSGVYATRDALVRRMLRDIRLGKCDSAGYNLALLDSSTRLPVTPRLRRQLHAWLAACYERVM